MAYELVTKIKCITNINSIGEKVDLTIGKEYKQEFSNATRNSLNFGVFGDHGNFASYSTGFFEVIKTIVRENTGFEIKCLDCLKDLTVEDIKKGKCPYCGQEVK